MVAAKGKKSSNPSTSHMISYPVISIVPLRVGDSRNMAENGKGWKEQFEDFFVLKRLETESEDYQMAMLRHALEVKGQRLAKEMEYSPDENKKDWRLLLQKMEARCVDAVNETLERYTLFRRDQKDNESFDDHFGESASTVQRGVPSMGENLCQVSWEK